MSVTIYGDGVTKLQFSSIFPFSTFGFINAIS